MKKFFILISIFVLTGCDNVDITKYPPEIQTCYNELLYDSNNDCIKNKKKIINFCQCFNANMEKKAAEIESKFQNTADALSFFGVNSSSVWISAREHIEKHKVQIAEECFKKIGVVCDLKK